MWLHLWMVLHIERFEESAGGFAIFGYSCILGGLKRERTGDTGSLKSLDFECFEEKGKGRLQALDDPNTERFQEELMGFKLWMVWTSSGSERERERERGRRRRQVFGGCNFERSERG